MGGSIPHPDTLLLLSWWNSAGAPYGWTLQRDKTATSGFGGWVWNPCWDGNIIENDLFLVSSFIMSSTTSLWCCCCLIMMMVWKGIISSRYFCQWLRMDCERWGREWECCVCVSFIKTQRNTYNPSMVFLDILIFSIGIWKQDCPLSHCFSLFSPVYPKPLLPPHI